MQKLRLLIVEDSKMMQAIYAHQLSDSLFEKTMVSDGVEATSAFETLKPDVIILDINIPIKNGYEVLKEIRVKYMDPLTTVIIVSVEASKDLVVACAKLGIQGYFIKPLNVNELNRLLVQYHQLNTEKIDKVGVCA